LWRPVMMPSTTWRAMNCRRDMRAASGGEKKVYLWMGMGGL